MKKIISLGLAALLTANLGVAVFADEPTMSENGSVSIISARDYSEAEKIASDLKALGLFKGVSDTDFDLDRAPTRTEAVVMLIRFLGKEAEALEGKFSHPFTDVPEWADAYVGYAYENKLTNGISATEFGASNDANSAMFLTFVLRALGYTDKDGEDFTWDNPYELAKTTGVLSDMVNTEQFYRADVAIVAHNALEAELKGTDITLSDKLIESGAFTAEEYAKVVEKAPDPEEPQPEKKKYNYRTDFTDYSPSDGLTEDGYFEGVNLSEYVDFTEYDSFDAEPYLTVTDAELNKAVAEYFPDYDFKHITDRAVVDGDTVSMTGTVYVNGVAEENLLEEEAFEIRKDYAEELSKSLDMFLPGLEEEGIDLSFVFEFMNSIFDGIIGSKPGDVKEIKFDSAFMEELIAFMELMGEDVSDAENYKDAEIVIKITVNYIYDYNIIPDLTDEMVREVSDFETVDEFVASVKETLVSDKQGLALVYMLASVKVSEIPDEIIEYFINSSLYSIAVLAKDAGMTLDEAVSLFSGGAVENVDEYVEISMPSLEESAKYAMLLLAIAEHEGITVSDEDMSGEEIAEAIEEGGAPYVKMSLLVLKTAEFFIEKLSIKD